MNLVNNYRKLLDVSERLCAAGGAEAKRSRKASAPGRPSWPEGLGVHVSAKLELRCCHLSSRFGDLCQSRAAKIWHQSKQSDVHRFEISLGRKTAS